LRSESHLIPNNHQIQANSFFLNSSGGAIFIIYHPAQTTQLQKKDVILIPPFADEMNKSRRSVSLLARALSAQGIGTLIIDLFGTGDSQGKFSEARWDIWLADIKNSVDWLKQQGNERLSVLGIRLGAILAMDAVEKQKLPIDELVLWQPCLSGKVFLNEFLRLRTSNGSWNNTGKKETLQDIRNMFLSGQSAEIAGYELPSQLAIAIDSKNLSAPHIDNNYPIHFFELVYDGTELSPASKQLVENWQKHNLQISTRIINAPPFWTGNKVTVVPELLDLTIQAFQGETAHE